MASTVGPTMHATDRKSIREGFLPQIYNVANDTSWVSGMKASTAWGLNIDLSYNYGNNPADFRCQKQSQ